MGGRGRGSLIPPKSAYPLQLALFVPNESTKNGKNKSAIAKGAKWAECGKEGSMLYHTLSQLAKDRPGDIYLRQTTKYSRSQTNSKETNTADKTNLQHSKTLP